MNERSSFRIFEAASAAARLAAASEFLQSFPADQPITIVGATRGAADDFARTIALERGATLGLARLSLTQLAARTAVVALAEEGKTPSSGLGAEAVAARAVFAATRETALRYFGPVAGLPGFPRALARTLQELRLAGITADAVRDANPARADLADLLIRFDESFADVAAADRAELLHTAARLLGERPVRGAILLLDVAVNDPAEAALIAGIIRAPSTYSPWNHPDAARRRSFVVLQRMREEGKITANQETAARAERIRIQPPPSVTSARNGYAKEFLRQQFRNVYGGDNPPDWKVHTSFLKDVQDAAETAVREGLRRQRVPGLQVALVALDPATGNVLAMVGGSDFATTPFNRAVNSRRQPGSAFKPFVYAVALEQGLSPVSRLQGLQQVAIEAPSGIWIPRDERATGRDEMSLREALLESNNAAAVLLQQRVGTRPVLQLTRNLGVSEQPDVPSLALGSGLVTPLELTTAYAVFPNGGFRVRSRGILAVEDAAGQTVESANVVRERVISEETAFQMVTMLQDVVARGTGAGARSYGLSSGFGGKTGSTNDYRDAWFVGFNSSVVVGVWTGFDQPQTIRQGGTGARVALPIWADFMRRVQRRLPSRGFSPPAGLEPHELCLISYQRPVDGCPSYIEYFKDGDDVPTQLCPIHEGTFKEDAVRAVDDLMRAIGRGIRGIFD